MADGRFHRFGCGSRLPSRRSEVTRGCFGRAGTLRHHTLHPSAPRGACPTDQAPWCRPNDRVGYGQAEPCSVGRLGCTTEPVKDDEAFVILRFQVRCRRPAARRGCLLLPGLSTSTRPPVPAYLHALSTRTPMSRSTQSPRSLHHERTVTDCDETERDVAGLSQRLKIGQCNAWASAAISELLFQRSYSFAGYRREPTTTGHQRYVEGAAPPQRPRFSTAS